MPEITRIIGGPFIIECYVSNDVSGREEPSASPYQAWFCVAGTETGIVRLSFFSSSLLNLFVKRPSCLFSLKIMTEKWAFKKIMGKMISGRSVSFFFHCHLADDGFQ